MMATCALSAALLPSKPCLLIILFCAMSDVLAHGQRADNYNVVNFIASWLGAFASFCILFFCVAYARNEYRQMNRRKANFSVQIREYTEHIRRKHNLNHGEAQPAEVEPEIYNQSTHEEFAEIDHNAAQSAVAQDSSTYDVLGSRNQTQPEEKLHHDTPISFGAANHTSSSKSGESVSGKTDPSSVTSANLTIPSGNRNSLQYTLPEKTRKRNSHSTSSISQPESEMQANSMPKPSAQCSMVDLSVGGHTGEDLLSAHGSDVSEKEVQLSSHINDYGDLNGGADSNRGGDSNRDGNLNGSGDLNDGDLNSGGNLNGSGDLGEVSSPPYIPEVLYTDM